MNNQKGTLVNKLSSQIILASNKKALFDYEVLSRLTAGIVLQGWEVASLRRGQCNLRGSFIFIDAQRVVVEGMHISLYQPSGVQTIGWEKRRRNLLLRTREIISLQEQISQPWITAVPLEIIRSGVFIKIIIGIVKGKKEYNKKQSIKERDLSRNAQREISFR